MAQRIPFAGESFALLSPAAAAQESMNCFLEILDDPNEKEKGKDIVRACPGAHLLATLTHANIQGMWSGGGRLFVVAGGFLYEVGQGTYPGTPNGGTIISSQNLGGYDTLPAWIQGNGTQLGIVTNGCFYIDNGAGAVKARFQLNGTVTINGAAVTWASGDQFPVYTPGTADPLPTVIIINGAPLAVTFTSATTATLGASLGGGSGTGVLFGDDTGALRLLWSTGATFDAAWAGLPIVYNGVTYTIQSVDTPVLLTLVQPLPAMGFQGPFAWSVSLPTTTNVPYSTAGGDLVTAVTGAWLDSFFLVQRPAGSPDLGRQVNFSAPNDGTSWAGLDFFTKESGPDYIQSILSDHELLFVFGTESSEVQQFDPNSGLPVRLPGMSVREGSAARWAPVALKEVIYFISGTPRGGPVAYRLANSGLERISTHAVEQAWTLGVFAPGSTDATSYAYIDQGHLYWVVNFSGTVGTWVYDATASQQLGTPIWHQRTSGGDALLPYRWWFHTYLAEWGGTTSGMHIVGDYLSGKLYELNSLFPDEDGADIRCVRALPYRFNGTNRKYFGRQDLEMETGDTAATMTEPTITRDYSDDRGHTFVNPQTAGVGLHADYSRRVFWPTGGSSRGRVWRYTWLKKDALTLIDLWAEDADGAV